jgi:uncharacterized protein
MLDTKVGAGKKAGFKVMREEKGNIVTGLKNKLSTMAAAVTPSVMLAEAHRKMTEPGSANKDALARDTESL